MKNILVREHHAPVGALRHVIDGETSLPVSQGAPRTCRCIETWRALALWVPHLLVREHHAPVGALRPGDNPLDVRTVVRSGSTTHL